MRTTIAIVLFALFTCGAGFTADPSNEQLREGLWKSPPPPTKAEAEFGAQDPYGLAIGEHIVVDCSIYWISIQDGKLYCFNSLTSKSYFIANPSEYLRDARAFLAGEKQKRRSSAGPD